MTTVTDYTALLSGQSWSGNGSSDRPVILTYSFETTAQPYLEAEGLDPTFLATFEAFNAAEQQLARDALDAWAAASGIIFIEVSPGQGDLAFGKLDFDFGPANPEAYGLGVAPDVVLDAAEANETQLGGDVFMDSDTFPDADPTISTARLMHYIGHALGLKHPDEGDTTLDASLDNTDNTIMSTHLGIGGVPTAPEALDEDAIQALYGLDAEDGTQAASWSWDAVNEILTQNGGAGDDIIRGVGVDDVMFGNDGEDILFGGGANDQVWGGLGNDALFGGIGDDEIGGGSGNDLVRGGDGEDLLKGSAGHDTLKGEADNDTLLAHGGNDTLEGGDGNDSLDGGIGLDTLKGGAGDDTLDGGVSRDTASYEDASGGVTVDLSIAGPQAVGGGEDNDTLINIECLIGSAFNDTLTGSTGPNTLSGLDGKDKLIGGEGRDTLEGGNGNDTLTGGVHNDLLDGGAGRDTASYKDAHGVTVDLSIVGYQAVHGGDGSDSLVGIENLGGSGLADTLLGDNLANALSGWTGDDTLDGNGSRDVLNGGAGDDTLTGGAGRDAFVFRTALTHTGVDTITDFDVAKDTIKLGAAQFSGLLGPGVLQNDAFFIGAAADDAEDRIIYNSATGALYYDADGTGGIAQQQIATLSTGLALTPAHFLIA